MSTLSTPQPKQYLQRINVPQRQFTPSLTALAQLPYVHATKYISEFSASSSTSTCPLRDLPEHVTRSLWCPLVSLGYRGC